MPTISPPLPTHMEGRMVVQRVSDGQDLGMIQGKQDQILATRFKAQRAKSTQVFSTLDAAHHWVATSPHIPDFSQYLGPTLGSLDRIQPQETRLIWGRIVWQHAGLTVFGSIYDGELPRGLVQLSDRKQHVTDGHVLGGMLDPNGEWVVALIGGRVHDQPQYWTQFVGGQPRRWRPRAGQSAGKAVYETVGLLINRWMAHPRSSPIEFGGNSAHATMAFKHHLISISSAFDAFMEQRPLLLDALYKPSPQ